MSPQQLDLLSMPLDPLPVRSTDPETARAAARDLPLRARQAEVADALRWIGVSATADEVRQVLREHGFDRERGEVASRLSELERLGVACKIGCRRNHKNRTVATWGLT